MEAPTWTIGDLTEEDLAKLPKGPREIMLLNLPIGQLLRLEDSLKTVAPLRQVLDDPRFWVKRMTQDGFILPTNAVEFAEKWRKKDKTAAQFLGSFYYEFRSESFQIIELTDTLQFYLPHFKKHLHRQEIYSSMKSLAKLIQIEQEELFKLDYDLTALIFSMRIFMQRYPRTSIVQFQLPNFAEGFDFEQGLLSDLLEQMSQSNIRETYATSYIPDPVGIIALAMKRKSNENYIKNKPNRATQKREDLEFYSEPGSLADTPAQEETRGTQIYSDYSAINIQAPGYEDFKLKIQQYLQLVGRLAHEGDMIVSGNRSFYIYPISDVLYIKNCNNRLPEEALPFLIREKLCSARQIHHNYRCVNLEISGREVRLTDHPDKVLIVNGHKFYVDSEGNDQFCGLVADLRCRWLISGKNKYPTRCNKNASRLRTDNYFCIDHGDSPEMTEQILRCQIEDGKFDSTEIEQEIIPLERFPLVGEPGISRSRRTMTRRPAINLDN